MHLIRETKKTFSMLLVETQKDPSNPLLSRTSGRNHCRVD